MSQTPELYSFIHNVRALFFPRRVIFGPKASEKIGEEVKGIGGRRALVVTDPTMVKIGYLDKIRESLIENKIKIEVYDQVDPDPHYGTVEAVAEVARKGKFDVVVGLGGGSPMDMAKVASLAIGNPGPIRDYEWIRNKPVEKKGPPMVMIPTTSGTGSEVSQWSVFSDSGIKTGIGSPFIEPDVALVDPLLTATMPPKVTVASGMDALSHAVEGILSLLSTPLTDALGLEAIRIIYRYLPTAYYNGRNLEARCYMSFGAMTAMLCGNSVVGTYGHHIGHLLGAVKEIPHGIVMGIITPYVMEFYAPVHPEKLAHMARAMDESAYNLPAREAAERAVQLVNKLTKDLDIPSLQEFDVSKEELPDLAKAVVRDYPSMTSPRELTEEQALQLLEKIWRGEL